MRQYLTFTKKEFREGIKSYKLLILLAIFIGFGILAPLSAKFLPEILKTSMPEGMGFELPVPTAADSWLQLYSNLTQLGFLTLGILYSGLFASEISKGTLIPLLTKGLPRVTVLLSKLSYVLVSWSVSLASSAAVCALYTQFFFKESNGRSLLFALFCLWLYGILLLSALFFFGVLFRSGYGCMLGTGLAAVALQLINIIPKIKQYLPVYLSSQFPKLLSGETVAGDMRIPILLCLCLSAALLAGAILMFQRKKL